MIDINSNRGSGDFEIHDADAVSAQMRADRHWGMGEYNAQVRAERMRTIITRVGIGLGATALAVGGVAGCLEARDGQIPPEGVEAPTVADSPEDYFERYPTEPDLVPQD